MFEKPGAIEMCQLRDLLEPIVRLIARDKYRAEVLDLLLDIKLFGLDDMSTYSHIATLSDRVMEAVQSCRTALLRDNEGVGEKKTSSVSL